MQAPVSTPSAHCILRCTYVDGGVCGSLLRELYRVLVYPIDSEVKDKAILPQSMYLEIHCRHILYCGLPGRAQCQTSLKILSSNLPC